MGKPGKYFVYEFILFMSVVFKIGIQFETHNTKPLKLFRQLFDIPLPCFSVSNPESLL